MKICLAQIQSLKGEIQKNLETHIWFIKQAIRLNSDIIVFPELSITNYEPELSNEIAKNENRSFEEFQNLADKNSITICVGMPTESPEGTHISMLIFQENQKLSIYSKQLLHEDELPYFVPGKNYVSLEVNKIKVGIGICYETLQLEHLSNSINQQATIYVASVAKPKKGVEKAFEYFPKMAKLHQIPILMVNSIGHCDNFLSMGQSAVWDKNGDLVNQLDQNNQGLLVYDTQTNKLHKEQLKIDNGALIDLKQLFEIFESAKKKLHKQGIFQWNAHYPSCEIIRNDLKKGYFKVLKISNTIIGAVNLSEEQEDEYKVIDWKYKGSKTLVIHRMVIDPNHQQKGYANFLMDFIKNFAKDNNYTSIRLDVYSHNTRVLQMYKKHGYMVRGEIYFPHREKPFYAMEKLIE